MQRLHDLEGQLAAAEERETRRRFLGNGYFQTTEGSFSLAGKERQVFFRPPFVDDLKPLSDGHGEMRRLDLTQSDPDHGQQKLCQNSLQSLYLLWSNPAANTTIIEHLDGLDLTGHGILEGDNPIKALWNKVFWLDLVRPDCLHRSL